ncbi:hypothetical protein [Actinoplanes sp. L3-i22]|uniref:hypothetical protein n=1 Tax=Actinoplanes sp. L3-i22 TaxID=2836373 RepID=UPI001C77E3E2|nr:hypothetical protein [Actinoplanes sp. L3-i22]BCY11835.1 hypothetical protein L3i22_069230 [Actinoplanes sp. L3-i22]
MTSKKNKKPPQSRGPGRAAPPASEPPAPTSAPPAGEEKQPWYKAMTAKIGGALLAIIVIAVGAWASKQAERHVPPAPDPKPTPGSGFEPAVTVIPRCGQIYAIDRVVDPDTDAAQLLGLAGSGAAGFNDFLRTERAAPVGSITVEVVFTGLLERPTRILDVRVDGLATTPSTAGTELQTYCGGDPPTRSVTLDMDTPPRSLMSAGKAYFTDRDLDVSVTERETLRISVSAARQNYRWYFAIDHIDATGARATSYLDAAGHLHTDPARVPVADFFAVTGAAKSYGARYTETGGRFRVHDR